MQDLRVTLVQRMLHWEDAVANRGMFAQVLLPLKGATDLIILPEMFTTGFNMRSIELAEDMNGATVQWMIDQAKKIDAAIYGSVIIKENGAFYNRGLFVKPDGGIIHYDKRHLFRFAGENDHYSAGTKRLVVAWRGWRLLLQICFDLRFPVFARNRGDYDAILYVANWPEARRYPWSQLLIARAIENQCYVAGVNRVGMDGKGNHYTGDSVMIDPRGAVIGSVSPGAEGCTTVVLDATALADFREKFPVGLDADDFEIKAQ
ncbi:MAG: amidohydrolase [Flavobacteriales bacterium]|jgi:omega-amidase|nr:amidohydrolase [Flavobacteriales bacterium]HOZ39193.1 amidohydrolase [Flavobacteriales bacterium]